MFFGFTLGLSAWVARRPFWASGGILIPTLFKIGPGFLYGIFLSSRPKERKKAIFSSIFWLSSVFILFFFWAHTHDQASQLWKNWYEIVLNDSAYYDASHYGSQSLKSFLLRGVRFQWFGPSTANTLYLFLAGFLCSGVSLFWLLRRARTPLGRGLFSSLGLFIYMWVMPETFKYSLTPLAIPVVLLLSSRFQSFFNLFAIGFGILTLSIAGKDIIGDSLFFGLQNYSIPLLATVFLAIAVFREAWKASFPSPLAKGIQNAWNSGKNKLGPWVQLPHSNRSIEISLLIPIPLQKSSSLDSSLILQFLHDCSALFQKQSPQSYEILLIPYGDRLSRLNPVLQGLEKAEKEIPALRILFPSTPEDWKMEGRGSALRAGFLSSRGKKILLSQIEQPCHPQFYSEAIEHLNAGFELVRANRRDSKSRFKIPVRSLSLVYGRHRLGMTFNQIVRFLLPLDTTDTQSGNLALSWQFAQQVFAVQTCPDFLFELELSLISVALSCREKDLPVTLTLAGEKSWRRVLLESLSILRGLPSLARRYRKGYYQINPSPQGITADDWGLSPGVNQGILRLAQLGVVRRVSMMANCPYLQEGLKELQAIPGIELGIHFNLTYGKPLQKNPNPSSGLLQNAPQSGVLISSPGKFLLRWLLGFKKRSLQTTHVRAELVSQLHRLQELEIPIQYLDGHHHIHLVPGLLDQVADLIQTAGIHQVRLPYNRSLWWSNKAPLNLLSLLARSKLKKYDFESLPCVYPKETVFYDQGQLRALLAQSPQSEVIVHPAAINDLGSLEFPDSYTSGRIIEFRALRMLGVH
jgi:predicted glycoside hydrolase/deacetylase ChbG (UPF0249 family)